MGKSDPKSSRLTPETRKASVFFSRLVLTPDNGLEILRERHTGGARVDILHVRRARDLLDEIYRAIVDGDEDRWKRLEKAWQAVCDEGAPALVVEPPTPTIEPPKIEPPKIEPPKIEPPKIEVVPMPEVDDGDETLPVESPLHNDTLPFKATPNPPPPPMKEEQRPKDRLAMTGEAVHQPRPSTPFDRQRKVDPDFAPTELKVKRRGLPTHLEALGIEQYALLCAECALYPQWIEQAQARYGVRSAAERAELDQHWRRRIAEDPAIEAEFRWHYQRYDEWARKQQR